MSEAGESIMRGLEEALDMAKGNDVGAMTHHVRVPRVDVTRIRAKTGLSQAEFSRTIGVAKGTLVNWEQGRRTPTGPAMVLLAMLNKNPSLVSQILSSDRQGQPV